MKSLVLIPTYNERDNIVPLIEQIREVFSSAQILVIDDASPDRTAERVREYSSSDRSVKLYFRDGKYGLGSAYREGFYWGLARDFDRFFTMDADFSHPPSRLPVLDRRLEKNNNDCVVGSRYTKGGKIHNWGPLRRGLSLTANSFARRLVGLSVRDCTSGFRGYRRQILETIELRSMCSEGYVFLVELVARVLWHGGTVEEIPFTFVDRRVGNSKIDRSEIFRGLLRVIQLAFEGRFR